MLFAAFVLSQLGWFFGGEQFLRSTTGLSAAEYARHGFFQMVAVVALVVPLLVATRAALRPGRDLLRRHRALALPLVGLLGLIIASAVLRLRLYVHYYGLSTDRIYPLVFMAWLGFVLLWLVATVLRNWGRPFIAGSVISGLVTLGALNVASPDAIVARVNTAADADWHRAGERPVDLSYLGTLSGEASAIVTRAVLSPSMLEAGTAATSSAKHSGPVPSPFELLRRWGGASFAWQRSERSAVWLTWNAGESAALNVVRKNEPALLRLRRTVCGATGNSRT